MINNVNKQLINLLMTTYLQQSKPKVYNTEESFENVSEEDINEATSAPTETSAKALALYLHDVSDGNAPLVFGLNKYIQGIAGLTGATSYLKRLKDKDLI